MNRLKTFMLVGVCVCILSPSKSRSALTDILQKYCVPTSGTNCTGISRATYNGSSCECSACNMYYDKSSRSCQTCPLGSYVNNRNSTECIRPTCGSGYYSEVEAGRDTCPSGYYREAFSSCR